MMMSSSSEIVDYQLKALFKAVDCSSCYVRIEPDLCNASPDMDNVSDRNISNLVHAGLNYVANNEDLLNDIVDKLIENDIR